MPVLDDNLRRIMRAGRIFDQGSQLGGPRIIPANDLPEQGGFGGNLGKGEFEPANFTRPQVRLETDSAPMFGPSKFEAPRQFGSVVDDDDYITRINDMYKPDHTMQQRYMKMIDEMPQRNQPGWKGRLLGLTGMFDQSGRTTDNILYGAYNRKMADWKNRMEPIEKGAELERSHNTNLRQTANQLITQERQDRNLERLLKRDKVLEDQGNRRGDQADRRLTATEFQNQLRAAAGNRDQLRYLIEKAKFDGGKFEHDDAGNSFMRHADGTITPVPGEYLSFEERQDAIERRQRNVQNNSPSFTRPRFEIRINERGEPEIIGIDPKTMTGKTVTMEGDNSNTPVVPGIRDTPTVQAKDVTNRANRLAESDPRFSKIVKIDKQGRVDLVKPAWYNGISMDDYNKAWDAIFGNQQPQQNTGGVPPRGVLTRPAPAANNQQMPPSGWVKVTGPQGPGRMSLEEWTRKKADLEKKGWKMVTGGQ